MHTLAHGRYKRDGKNVIVLSQKECIDLPTQATNPPKGKKRPKNHILTTCQKNAKACALIAWFYLARREQ